MKKIYLGIFMLFSTYSFCQTNAFQQFHNESSLVIEGKIISSNSYFDANGEIFTNYDIKTSQLLKGDSGSLVTIKTLGGIVDGHFQLISHQIKFKLNDEGIFFLNESNSSDTYILRYRTRFINYKTLESNSIENMNEDLLEIYPNFNTLKPKANENIIVMSANTIVVDNISPLEISAGTNSELTIDGSGFGTEKGTVGFRNANDGGSSFVFTYSEIIQWTDTKIIVEVPDLAGSGGIKIKRADNLSLDTYWAGLSVSIPYSQFTIKTAIFGDSITVPLRHIGAMPNGSDPSDHLSGGGYKFKMTTEFFNNTNAKTMFLEGLSDWSCKTGVNFEDAGLLTASDSNNTNNLVRFADFNANGYGGAAFTSLKGIYGCGNDEEDYVGVVTNIDFVYDSNIDWGYDVVSNNQFDFEWTTAHEIGHASLFLHVIDQSNLMHYAGSYGDLNFQGLSQTYIDAGIDKVNFSSSPFLCGLEMSISDCYQTFATSDIKPRSSIKIKSIGSTVHVSTNNKLEIQGIYLFDISGRKVKEITLKMPSNDHYFNVNSIPSQIYFLKLNLSDNTTYSRKIIL